jgi:uncharacterized membrane protein
MESRVKLAGHAIHPMLIVIPLGVLATSLVFDIVRAITNRPMFSEIAFWDIAVGVVGGLLAAIFGLLDWLAIPSGTRAKTVGLWHGGGNVVVVGIFIISWLLRLGNPSEPGVFPVVLSIIAVLLALVTAWLGGELVERLRVGVDEGAGLDAPNSLSSRSATRPMKQARGIG